VLLALLPLSLFSLSLLVLLLAQRHARGVAAPPRESSPVQIDASTPAPAAAKLSVEHVTPAAWSGRDVLVVGSAASAAQTVLRLVQAGARVTLSDPGAGLGEVEVGMRGQMEQALADRAFRALWRSHVVSIQVRSVTLRMEGAQACIANDHVLLMSDAPPMSAWLRGMRLCGPDSARNPVTAGGVIWCADSEPEAPTGLAAIVPRKRDIGPS
jgi:hypothetical protein